jgi:hypothetical protein
LKLGGKERKLSEKRKTVDFKRDIVLLDVVKKLQKDNGFLGNEALNILRHYANDDAKRIQRLRIGTTWDRTKPVWEATIRSVNP